MKQRYDSYKPSGINWIGDIPSHWNIMPIKQICRSEKYAVKTGPFGSQLKGEDLRENGDIRVYNQRNVIDNDFSDVTSFVTSEKAKELDSFYTRPNDLLITSRGTIGKSAILPSSVEMGILHPCLIALRIDISQANLKWVQRWINDSEAFRIEIVSKSNATTIDVIYTETIKNIRLALPPIAEQEAISAWLDEKCGEIDAAIAKVDREIELIDELKQSEISRVVTRGPNPDVSLRPSGIDWINEIPINWSSMKLKHTVKNIETDFMDGDWIESSDISTEGIRYLTSGNIGAGIYKEQGDGFITEETFASLNCIEVFPGDLLISRLNEPIARTCLIPELGYRIVTCVDNVIYRPLGNRFDKRFMMYQLNCRPFWFNASQLSRGATMQRISRSKLGAIKVIVPPLSEQQEIADYLDKKCAKIDGLKAKLTKKRETLTELRQSIISEVVTGKRKVI